MLDRLTLPRLGLPTVLAQLAGTKPQPEPPEPAASLDGGELLVVAYQHDLGVCLGGVVEQAGELAGAEHPGLVHHQHGPLVQHALSLVIIARAVDTSRITAAAGW